MIRQTGELDFARFHLSMANRSELLILTTKGETTTVLCCSTLVWGVPKELILRLSKIDTITEHTC